jgi:hypothetical protein
LQTPQRLTTLKHFLNQVCYHKTPPKVLFVIKSVTRSTVHTFKIIALVTIK